MKILFITDLYPLDKNEKGIPKTLKSFVDKWHSWGHNIVVIRPNLIPNVLVRGRKIKWQKVYNVDGVKVYNRNYFTTSFKNLSFLKERNFDVIVAHMPTGILFAHEVKKQLHIPLVAGVHASDIRVLTNWKYRRHFGRKLNLAYHDADMMAFRSYWLQEKIALLEPELMPNSFVAYSGIEKEFIMPKEKMLEKFKNWENRETYKFVCAANLIKRKNVHLVIKSLSFIKEKNWELEIVGDGEMRGSLEKLAKQSGVYNKVKFTGKLPREEVIEHMRKADVFLLPSENETFGLVYLEAMASGCITICTKESGADGIIVDGVNGFSATADINAVYSEAISILRLSQNEVNSIISNTWETINDYTSDIAAQNYLQKLALMRV